MNNSVQSAIDSFKLFYKEYLKLTKGIWFYMAVCAQGAVIILDHKTKYQPQDIRN